MRTLILLLTLPILLLLCALTAYWAPLPAALDGSRDQIAAIAFGLLGLGYVAGLLLYLLYSLRRATRALDPVLFPLGYTARWAPPLGRHYAGGPEAGRRPVEIVYRPAYARQPASLDLTIRAQPGLRLAATAGPQRPLLDCRDCPRLEAPGLPGIYVYAADEPRARTLLARPEIPPALDRLLNNPDASGTSELYLQADRAWLRARPRVSQGEIAAWIDDALPALIALAQASERSEGP